MNDLQDSGMSARSAMEDDRPPSGPTELLRQRRFGPFFLTQFLGAFNDNVFKNALIGLLTFQLVRLGAADGNTQELINISAGLFILPFFLFSATAGQLADKYEKSMLIRRIKIGEIVVMSAGALALLFGGLQSLLVVLFLMGTQSSFFGPVKYGILPQHLREEELIGGNALVEAGTFLAILLGTLAGGLLVDVEGKGPAIVAGIVMTIAILGWLSSLRIPAAQPMAASLEINWNIPAETFRILNYTRENQTVFLSIMGISWFWFYGSVFLVQVPAYAKDFLDGSQQVVSLLLATFTIGIAVGSLICERASGRLVEIGLVPIGALGMAWFAIDLSLIELPTVVGAELTAREYLAQPGSWRVLIDLGLIAVSGGLYIVPLYALVQIRTDPGHRSRVIAGLNIMNALFMVVAALFAYSALKTGLTIPELLLVVALMHIAVAVFIFSLVPEFAMRLIVWLLVHTIYRVEKEGLRNIPIDGPAVLVCNHVSYVDALLLGSVSRRPLRFVMYHKIFKIPILSFVFRTGRAIPIAPAHEDERLLRDAYEQISQGLEDGDILCIFPEGKLTADGEMNDFKTGIERILERNPVPVVPVALQNLWGSFFTRASGGKAFRSLPRKLWAKIRVVAGEPLNPETVSAASLQESVAALRGDHP